jgi:hypothetical protein
VKRLISNKTLWGLHRGQGRAEEISAWAAANSIDPDTVSTDHDLIVEDGPDGRAIRYQAYLLTLDGAKYHVDGVGTAMEERTTPLVVEPPEHWPVWALADERPKP